MSPGNHASPASRPPDALARTVARYCRAWGIAGRTERMALLRACVTADVHYRDPTVEVAGIEALGDHIGTVIARYPGAHIEVTSAVDVHHLVLRFAWRKVLADGSSLPEGLDVCELADDGRLRRIIGFFGTLRR